MAPRPDVSEERRGQILEAAAAVFARVGVHDARMDDIVREAGLSKGALYWYFKSKDDLVAALVERLFARGNEEFKEFLKSDLHFKNQMLAIAGYVAEEIGGRVSKLRSVALEYYALAARDAKVRRRVRMHIDETISLFAAMIRRAIERGECRVVDPRKTAMAIEGAFEGFTVLWLLDTTGFKIDQVIDHSTRLMLESLLPKK